MNRPPLRPLPAGQQFPLQPGDQFLRLAVGAGCRAFGPARHLVKQPFLLRRRRVEQPCRFLQRVIYGLAVVLLQPILFLGPLQLLPQDAQRHLSAVLLGRAAMSDSRCRASVVANAAGEEKSRFLSSFSTNSVA